MAQFATSASSLSWNLLTTVPPLVCAQPNTTYCRECHQKEMLPVWNDKLDEYDLVYYRPTLFLSYEGKVARKGWVGNKERLVVPSEDARSSQTQADNGTSHITTLQGGPLIVPSATENPTGAAVSKSPALYHATPLMSKCLVHGVKRTSASPKVYENLASGTVYMKSPSALIPIKDDTSSHDLQTETTTSSKEGKMPRRQSGGSTKGAETDDQFSLMQLWLFK